MKVLQVHTEYRDRGGEDAVVEAEAALLASAGHEVVPLRTRNSKHYLKAAVQLAASTWNPVSARRLREAAHSIQPDIMHVHNTWFALSPSVFSAAAGSGAAVVMTLHNFRLACTNGLLFRDGRPCEDCVDSHPWHGVVHRCYRESAVASAAAAANISLHRRLATWSRFVDLFFALSDFARPRLISAGVPEDRVVVKPNFSADPGPRRGAPGAARTVLFVGRLAEEKGIFPLLEAWRGAAMEDLELVVIGDGPAADRARAVAPPNVRLLGWRSREEVTDWMLTARALVLPSVVYEGQPVTFLEALSAGLPVLASALGGTRELGDALGGSWLVPPGDVAAWADGLKSLEDTARVNAAGRESRAIYESRFSPARQLERLEQGYSTAMRLGAERSRA